MAFRPPGCNDSGTLQSGRFGGESRDANLLISVGGGDSDAIGMEVHVASEGGQLEAVE